MERGHNLYGMMFKLAWPCCPGMSVTIQLIMELFWRWLVWSGNYPGRGRRPHNHVKTILRSQGEKAFRDWEQHLNKTLEESNSCRVGK